MDVGVTTDPRDKKGRLKSKGDEGIHIVYGANFEHEFMGRSQQMLNCNQTIVHLCSSFLKIWEQGIRIDFKIVLLASDKKSWWNYFYFSELFIFIIFCCKWKYFFSNVSARNFVFFGRSLPPRFFLFPWHMDYTPYNYPPPLCFLTNPHGVLRSLLPRKKEMIHVLYLCNW